MSILADRLKRSVIQADTILRMLEEAGLAGVPCGELAGVACQYGARIYELRARGKRIISVPGKDGRNKFVLVPPGQQVLF